MVRLLNTYYFVVIFASNSDPTLFVKKNGKSRMVVLLYVDDMVVTRNNGEDISNLWAELLTRFEIKDLGELSHLLRLEVENLKDGIFLSQRSYASKMVERFGFVQSKKCST